jgi:MraZ protein
MFFGYYEHNLDNKGRTVIPSKMREETGAIVYITKGYDGALTIFKKEDFEKMLIESRNIPFNKRNSRAYLRAQFSSACELEIDKQGRIQIPQVLLTKYAIGKELVILGVGDHIEIWDKAKYLAYEEEVNNNFEEIAENLEKDC